MTYLSSDISPHLVQVFALAGFLAAGFALGLLYFADLWWTVRLFTASGQVPAVIALTIGRFALLGGALVLASLNGAWPLLLVAFGILAGRFAVMRRVREGAS